MKRLKMFKFIGKIIAKAIYEEILIEPIFSKVLLNMLLH
jgi:ubiquitin-protein ligase E3 C